MGQPHQNPSSWNPQTPTPRRRGLSRMARPAAAGPSPLHHHQHLPPRTPHRHYRRKPVSRGATGGANPIKSYRSRACGNLTFLNKHPPPQRQGRCAARWRLPIRRAAIAIPFALSLSKGLRPPSSPAKPATPPPARRHPDTASLRPHRCLRYRLPMVVANSHRNHNITAPHTVVCAVLLVGRMVHSDGQSRRIKQQEGWVPVLQKKIGFVAEMCQASYDSTTETSPRSHETSNPTPSAARHPDTASLPTPMPPLPSPHGSRKLPPQPQHHGSPHRRVRQPNRWWHGPQRWSMAARQATGGVVSLCKKIFDL